MKMTQVQKTIKRLLEEDQKDRASKKLKQYSVEKRWKFIQERDKKRIKLAKDILKNKPLLRGIDYFRIGLIFQHGITVSWIEKAKQMGKKSMKLDYAPGKWLYAAATDRILMMQGKKQKFGTQFINRNGQWRLYPVRKSTSDKERSVYNVSSLQEIKRVVQSLNKGKTPRKKLGLTRKE